MSTPASDPSAVPPIQSAKAALRKTLLTARRCRTTDPRLAEALLSLPEMSAASVVAAYAALPGEPDVATALVQLRNRGVRVLLPVVQEDRDLEFREDLGSLVAGRLGVLVPPSDTPLASLVQADVVIVPALAVDQRGHRLGRGGGSYDRALRRVRPDALIMAVVYPDELLPQLPVEAHDVRIHAVLAGTELIRVQA